MASVGAAPSSSLRVARASPFRESEWDRKLDGLLEDLEGSAGGGGGGGGEASSKQLQSYSHQSSGSHQISSSTTAAASSSYRAQQSSYSATSLASQMRGEQQQQQQSSSFSARQQDGGISNGFSVAKSPSSSAMHDSMLKDLEGSLKASSNYLESHRTVSGPGTTSEYHEYRSYSRGDGGAARDGGDFNLEKQVQHMMPPGSLTEKNGYHSSSGNMVSSVQQKQSYSSYKVQSNQVKQMHI